MIAELERLTRAEMGETATHLDYVVQHVESGGTILRLAKTIGARIGMDIKRAMLSAYLHETWGEEAEAALSRARARGAHALVEGARDRAAEVEESRDAIAKAKLVNDIDLFIASRWNRAEFGEQKGPTVQISLGGAHLDALRVRVLESEDADYEVIGHNEQAQLPASVEDAST